MPVLGVPRAPLSATLPNAEAELSVSEAAWKGGSPHQLVSVLGPLLPTCRGGNQRRTREGTQDRAVKTPDKKAQASRKAMS